MMTQKQNILVLAPHTDDGELGCGGTISLMNSQGSTINYVAFSSCEQSVPSALPKDILRKEVLEATFRLGIPVDNVFIEEFEVRKFSNCRQQILETMIRYRRQLNPDIVFIPALSDVHQDHQTIRNEAIRAFKNCTILGYELPWNMFTSDSRFFFCLSEEHVNKKLEALSAYKSQSGRNYFNRDFIKGLACVRGVQSGTTYAEAFEVVRFVYNNINKPHVFGS